ncbi:hypothetical protein MHLP_00895 [Candidatus Mycoplasma haematolamae str. Purdue]|uniref:Uncharacterized protein n=1 Tax=Mycoplasma haematolamae (strain Purdue) TaxID=1212765 RepID=I7CIQ9_MYCHA|nr:hypothetical protein [Candidatus Mycoplasma haematolamae]AFO51759.1 hypothetical protein MHLP_00895 [Candidatus Mycoplasma haematolamae str. Purdue]
MILKTIAWKVVVPTVLAGGTVGGGGYVAYTNLIAGTAHSEGNRDLDSSSRQQVQEIEKGSFKLSLAGTEPKVAVLKCKSPDLTDSSKHYTIQLVKESSNKAEVKCFVSEKPQEESSLKPKPSEQKGEEDVGDSDPISNLQCDSYQDSTKGAVNIFQCRVSGSHSLEMTLNEGESKVLFEIKTQGQ